MPRVDRDAEVTLVVLVYRSLRWLEWCMDGVDSSKQETRYRWLVVGNDATEEVRSDRRVNVDWRNENPHLPYPQNIGNIYRAWNEGVLNSPTPWCILLNTDMFCTDHAVDEIVKAKREVPDILPCGLLVEHGRIPSGMPEYVKGFGTNPDNFRRQEFLDHAKALALLGGTEPGRLYQPVLFDRQEFLDLGGYPEGNIAGVSGDKILFGRYRGRGFGWVTCKGSIWYHAQEGETRWP